MGFPRQEYWSGLPFPSSGDLSNPGIKPVSPALASISRQILPPGKPLLCVYTSVKPRGIPESTSLYATKLVRYEEHEVWNMESSAMETGFFRTWPEAVLYQNNLQCLLKMLNRTPHSEILSQ